jgi:hypothetical protein
MASILQRNLHLVPLVLPVHDLNLQLGVVLSKLIALFGKLEANNSQALDLILRLLEKALRLHPHGHFITHFLRHVRGVAGCGGRRAYLWTLVSCDLVQLLKLERVSRAKTHVSCRKSHSSTPISFGDQRSIPRGVFHAKSPACACVARALLPRAVAQIRTRVSCEKRMSRAGNRIKAPSFPLATSARFHAVCSTQNTLLVLELLMSCYLVQSLKLARVSRAGNRIKDLGSKTFSVHNGCKDGIHA